MDKIFELADKVATEIQEQTRKESAKMTPKAEAIQILIGKGYTQEESEAKWKYMFKKYGNNAYEARNRAKKQHLKKVVVA